MRSKRLVGLVFVLAAGACRATFDPVAGSSEVPCSGRETAPGAESSPGETPLGQPATAADSSIIAALRNEFQRRNPQIDNIVIEDLRFISSGRPRYLMVGWAYRSEPSGNADDELFGVFIIDGDLTRLESTLEIITSPRRFDTAVAITGFDGEQVVIVGKSKDYGHKLLMRRYDLPEADD